MRNTSSLDEHVRFLGQTLRKILFEIISEKRIVIFAGILSPPLNHAVPEIFFS